MIKIRKEPIWIVEAMSLCYMKVNDKKIKMTLDNNQRSAYYKILNKDVKNALKKLDMSEDLKYFFKAYENDGCLANTLLYSYFDFIELDQDNLKDEWIKRLSKAFDMSYAKDKMSFFGLELSTNSGYDLWNWFEEYDFNNQDRYQLIKALHHPTDTIYRLMDILEETVILLKNELKNDEKELNTFFDELVSQQTTLNHFLDNHPIKWSEEAYIIPSYVDFDFLRCVTREYFPRFLNVFYGAGVDFDYVLHFQISDSGKNNEFLKVISDQSKYEILKLLKEKMMYGQEIANKMKLKTPTISYHMDALVNLGIVTVKRQDNRVYYGLNKEVLIGYLDRIKEEFI
ncbi:winged helix-turn-helix domain-containing protein [Longibaculum muris]|uniref:winged helix-turn-helix domain-containing protein n=1 Tax=Longibaculum muris TaxID=1796628 RepID=UPI0022E0DD1C|nr:winged helix-turn-helix domain-containing protein [Longibaculum muris]